MEGLFIRECGFPCFQISPNVFLPFSNHFAVFRHNRVLSGVLVVLSAALFNYNQFQHTLETGAALLRLPWTPPLDLDQYCNG